ncbi:hypothetical protein GGQ95_003637 [Anoxybacillus rupiensis]|nr:hypothetical protein [Anoxybacillus rupiensis]
MPVTCRKGKVKSTISMAISYISFTSYLLVGYLGDMINIRFIYLALSIIIILGGTFSMISIYLLKIYNRQNLNMTIK